VNAHFTDTSVITNPAAWNLGYAWSFGDNTTGSGMTSSHLYANKVANYTVIETITATNPLTGNKTQATASQVLVVGCSVVVPSTCATKNQTGTTVCGPNGVYLFINGSTTTSTGVSCATNGGGSSIQATLTPLALALVIAGAILILWQWIPFTKPRYLSGILVVIVIGGLIYILGSGAW
jgi:hypothetical protein